MTRTSSSRGSFRHPPTRLILLDPRLTLFAPEHLLKETAKHLRSASRLRKRIGLSESDLSALFVLLSAHMVVVPQEEYALALDEALRLAPHREEAPYLALALTLDVPLWSNDAGMRKQRAVRVITTTELIHSLI